MKILLLCRSLEIGGAETQLVQSAIGLARLGWQVHVVCLYLRGPLVPKLISHGIACSDLHKKNRWDLVGPISRLGAIIRQVRPQVIYSFLSISNLIATLCKPFAPQAVIVWGIRNSADLKDQPDLVSRVVAILECFFASRADLIIANSTRAADKFRKVARTPDRVTVLPNGIDTDYFTADTPKGSEFRALINAPPNSKIVGIVARLDPQKDHATFFRAMASLIDKGYNICPVVVGNGPASYAAELHKLCEKLSIADRVRWCGEVSNMPKVYAALDLVVLTSTTEGFPNVLAEAMSCGVLCVSTNVGEAGRIIQDDRLIAKAKDSASVAQAIVRALSMPHNTLEIRKSIVSRYGVADLCGQLDRLFRNIAQVQLHS